MFVSYLFFLSSLTEPWPFQLFVWSINDQGERRHFMSWMKKTIDEASRATAVSLITIHQPAAKSAEASNRKILGLPRYLSRINAQQSQTSPLIYKNALDGINVRRDQIMPKTPVQRVSMVFFN